MGKHQLPDLTVSLQQNIRNQSDNDSNNTGVQLSVTGEALKGELWIPEQSESPWALNVNHLILPDSSNVLNQILKIKIAALLIYFRMSIQRVYPILMSR